MRHTFIVLYLAGLLAQVPAFAAPPSPADFYHDTPFARKLQSGNEIMILGEATYENDLRTRLETEAERYIHHYTLVVENDPVGRATVMRLAARAFLDGIEVNFIYHPLTQVYLHAMPLITVLWNTGVNVRGYWPRHAGIWLYKYLLIGCHKKLLLVDSARYGQEAIIGGRNIGEQYLTNVPDPQPGEFANIWRDIDVLVRGPLVADFMRDYIRRFNELSFGRSRRLPDERDPRCPYFPQLRIQGDDPACIPEVDAMMLENEPDDRGGRGVFEINEMYRILFDRATVSIDIENPYFIPQRPILEKLYAALDRGVRVRILTSSRGGNDMGDLVFLASAYFFRDLVRRGTEIYLWDLPKRGKGVRLLHSKFVVVDSLVFMPGSWNFDGRSWNHENEYALPVFDRRAGMAGSQLFEEDLAVRGVERIGADWVDENLDWWDKIKMRWYILFAGVI